MIRTLIIEDEPAVRKEIAWLLQQHPQFNLLGEATSVSDSLVLIKATAPTLVLMDIQLTDGTAFDILRQLENISFKIIFITAYDHFAVKAIKYGALDYLLKPLDATELQTALAKISATSLPDIAQQQQQLAVFTAQADVPARDLESRLVLHTAAYLQVLQLKEIIYCQSEGSYSHFFLTEGRIVMVSKPLKFYDELLPEKWFLRPHQSYLVNLCFVDKLLKSGSIRLKDQTEIPVSSRRKDYINQQIHHIR